MYNHCSDSVTFCLITICKIFSLISIITKDLSLFKIRQGKNPSLVYNGILPTHIGVGPGEEALVERGIINAHFSSVTESQAHPTSYQTGIKT